MASLFGQGLSTLIWDGQGQGHCMMCREQASQRKKLPFTLAYTLGLLGTLWATFIRRSYIFTAIFAVIQLVSLLYYICSHFPGGTSTLNLLGRMGGRSARSLIAS
eukprot:symbB.v1.2.007678.t1/scaffold475.1/size199048/19